MSTLTKILIVVMVVGVIFASVLAIQHVSTGDNFKVAYEGSEGKRVLAESQARKDRMALEAANKQLEEIRAAADQAAKDAADQASRDKMAKAQLTSENARLENTVVGMNTKLASLEGSVAEQVAMNKQLTAQLNERLAMVQELNDQLRKTTLQAQELSRNLETARQNVNVKQTLLTAAEEKVRELQEKLRQGGGLAATGVTAAPIPATAIQGRVEAVSIEDNVAQLNVGAASGVTAGMKFILYRGNQYIGEFTVAQVEAGDCAGTLSQLQIPPQRGDKATTSLDME